jgi:prolyl oligopeptidase
MALTLSPLPPTSIEPVTEILHGVAITDHYRWLEDQDSPRTREWLETQTTYTRAYLDAIPGRDRIRKRVEKLLDVEVISEPWTVGGRYFYRKRVAGGQQPVIMMRKGERGEEIALVDPAQTDATGTTAVNILTTSSDGTLLAYSVRQGGEDFYEVKFIDVETQEHLSDRLARGFCRGLVLTEDRSGFYYTHEPISANYTSYRAVFYHAFGTSNLEDKEIFVGGSDPELQLVLLSSPSGRRLGYYKLFKTDPKRIDFAVQDISVGTPPHWIVEQIEGLFAPCLLDNELLALTDWKAPNCRFVKIDLNHPEPENWRDVVPECGSRIQNIAVVGESIFVTSVEELATRVEIFDFSGKNLGTIPLPSRGTASLFPCRTDSTMIFYRFSSFAHPPSIFGYHPQTGEHQSWTRSQVKFDPSSIEIEQVRYPSKDGTPVHMFLVSRKGLRDTRPLPTFLTGYGGFGTSITPQFTAYATYLIERGCLFAVANLRGGAEFGEEWHLAAKRQKRQTAIDDFIAAAEWLLVEKHAAPGRMAIGGGSNAGLLVGAAFTQRPDLFRAVICLGPLLDMLRYHRFDLADSWIDEYGSAEIESDFRALLEYSPYHRVVTGAAYPAVMLISGDADTRCNPMHARKMAARLQAATTSGHPILLDYKPLWGHTPVQSLTRRIDALTDRLAFLSSELGLNG